MNKNIFWIASYPKSGNTLVRGILSSIFFTKDGIFSLSKLSNINQFERTDRIKKNKKLFGDDYLNLKNSPVFYKHITKLQTKEALGIDKDFTFLKTHSGLFEIGGNSFTKKENSQGLIYVIRDPRDVCISWSKHLNLSIDKCIDNMTNDLASSEWVEPKEEIFRSENRPMSFLSSWEKHVLSWTSINWEIPIKIIRFEDLISNKKEMIKEIIFFFITNYNFKFENVEDKINNILDTTDFFKLKKEEEEKGFLESTGNNVFFSSGKKEQWKEILTKDQISKIEKKFGSIMKKFQYKLAVEI